MPDLLEEAEDREQVGGWVCGGRRGLAGAAGRVVPGFVGWGYTRAQRVLRSRAATE